MGDGFIDPPPTRSGERVTGADEILPRSVERGAGFGVSPLLRLLGGVFAGSLAGVGDGGELCGELLALRRGENGEDMGLQVDGEVALVRAAHSFLGLTSLWRAPMLALHFYARADL